MLCPRGRGCTPTPASQRDGLTLHEGSIPFLQAKTGLSLSPLGQHWILYRVLRPAPPSPGSPTKPEGFRFRQAFPRSPASVGSGEKYSNSSSLSTSPLFPIHRSVKMVDPCLLLWGRFSEKVLTKGLGNQSPLQLTTRVSGKYSLLSKLHFCENIVLREPPLRTQGQTLPPSQPPALFQALCSMAHLGLDPPTIPATFPDAPKYAMSEQLKGRSG